MAGEYNLSLIMTATDQASSVIEGMISELDPLTGFALGAGVAIVGIGVKAVEMASTFQSAMNKVQVYTGLTQQQTKQMGDQILQMAPQLGQSADDMAAGLYTVATAGYRGTAALTILRYAGETSASANVDATTTMQALVHSMDALQVGASQSGNIMDELNMTVKQGDMTWQQYGTVVGKLAGAVSVAGGSAKLTAQNFIDLNSSLDVYTNSGVSARQASMNLNADMSLLDGKITTIETHAAKLGVSFNATAFQSMSFAQQLHYLNKVTDGNRAKLVQLLGGNSTVANSVTFLNHHYSVLQSTIQNVTKGMQNGKTTNDLFSVTQKTLAFQTQVAKESFNSLMIQLGERLLPIVTPLVTAFGQFMQMLARLVNFIATNQTALDAFIAILITIALVILDAVVPAIIAASIAALPWILAFLAVAAVVFLVILVITHFGAIITFFSTLWHTVWSAVSSFFVGIWNSIVAFLVGVWNHITSFVSGAVAAVVNFIKAHWQLLVAIIGGPLVAIVLLIIDHWNDIKNAFNAAIAWIVGLVTGFWNDEVRGWTALWNDVKSVVTSLWNDVVTLFTSAKSRVVSAVTGLWSGVTGFLSTLPGQMLHWGEDLIQNLINGIMNMAGGVINAVSGIASKIASFLHFTKPEMGPLSTADVWMNHFGDLLSTGLAAQASKLKAAVGIAVSPIAASMNGATSAPALGTGAPASGGMAGAGTSVTTITINYTSPAGTIRQQAIALMDEIARIQRMSGQQVKTASGRRY